ncbi:MAG: N-acetylneuraminate synthase family protein [Actinomycetota bacterium]|nr:N-acetylneuraminate synthase family protein [Actinomycetota bacterium]
MSLPPDFRLGERMIGASGEAAYVIAEAGSNHNRDLDVARQLIDVATEAGCDAVKFQTYSGDRIYSRVARSRYLEGFAASSPAELLEDISLPREWHFLLAEHSRERGIGFFSSPFDHQAVDELAEVGVPLLKIASGEIVDLPLIRRAAATGIPLVISTGMATLAEVGEALAAAEGAGANAVALMQCASVYPATAALINLRAVDTLRAAFGVPAGLSDHTMGIAVPIAAAARGSAMIEKHITLDRTMQGPDHSFATEPGELEAMVAGIRAAEAALGDGRKEGPSAEELDENYTLARRSLIATRDLAAGTVLEAGMITVKRPGTGIAPKHMELVIGRPLRADVQADDVLTWRMV